MWLCPMLREYKKHYRKNKYLYEDIKNYILQDYLLQSQYFMENITHFFSIKQPIILQKYISLDI